MFQQTGPALSHPLCCCGPNYPLKPRGACSPSCEQVWLPWGGRDPVAVTHVPPPPATPQLWLRELCWAPLGYKPSHMGGQAGEGLALPHLTGHADLTFPPQARLPLLTLRQRKTVPHLGHPKVNPQGRWQMGRTKRRKTLKSLPPSALRQAKDIGRAWLDLLRWGHQLFCTEQKKVTSHFWKSSTPPFNPEKPLIKLLLHSKEWALPEELEIHCVKTCKWRRQRLSRNTSSLLASL